MFVSAHSCVCVYEFLCVSKENNCVCVHTRHENIAPQIYHVFQVPCSNPNQNANCKKSHDLNPSIESKLSRDILASIGGVKSHDLLLFCIPREQPEKHGTCKLNIIPSSVQAQPALPASSTTEQVKQTYMYYICM